MFPARYMAMIIHGAERGEDQFSRLSSRNLTSPMVITVRRNVVGYDAKLTTKLKASPAGGPQTKMTVTAKWVAKAKIGVRNGRFSMTILGNGVTLSLASSWITRAIEGKRFVRYETFRGKLIWLSTYGLYMRFRVDGQRQIWQRVQGGLLFQRNCRKCFWKVSLQL